MTFLPSKCLFHVNFMLQKGLQNYSKFTTVFCRRLLFLLRSASSSVNWSTPSPRQGPKILQKKWLILNFLWHKKGYESCLIFTFELKIPPLSCELDCFHVRLYFWGVLKMTTRNCYHWYILPLDIVKACCLTLKICIQAVSDRIFQTSDSIKVVATSLNIGT